MVTSGIICDNPNLLAAFEENNIAIAADDVAHESRAFRVDVPFNPDPMMALAEQFAAQDYDVLLYDPESSKNRRGEFVANMVKESGAQGLERLFLVLLVHEIGDVVVARAVGNHAHRDAREGLHDAGRVAHVVVSEVAHDADDGHVLLYADRAHLFQFLDDEGETRSVVDGQRDGHFGGRDHIDTRLVLAEYLEHALQVARGKQHPVRHDLDHGDVVLGCDGLDTALLHLVVDDGAGGVGVHRVEQADGHAGEAGRLDARRVQDFCAEVRELGRLVEVELAHRFGVLDKPRVVVVHSVDVRPYLDFGRLQRCADEAGRIVGPAALQVGDFALGVAADEALRDIDVVAGIGLELFLQLVADVAGVGLVVGVEAHIVQRGDERRLDALLLHVERHHIGAHDFPLGQHDFLLGVTECPVRKRAQHGEDVAQHLGSFLGISLGVVELADVLAVLGAQLVDDAVGCFGIILTEIIRNLHECVGRARHGGEYDDFLLPVVDETYDVLHALRRPHGGSAKLQNFHAYLCCFC